MIEPMIERLPAGGARQTHLNGFGSAGRLERVRLSTLASERTIRATAVVVGVSPSRLAAHRTQPLAKSGDVATGKAFGE